MALSKFDSLYVISDLHMGGKTGFQILRETDRLANFINWVDEQQPGDHIGLVLNGDVIDTLAEEDVNGYIAVDNAVDIVKRIIEDDAFNGIWQALKNFVKDKNHTLIFILGNHDIELALPNVQRYIFDFLAGKKTEIRSRIEFSTIGAGYTCKVGESKVFCTHGNEVDSWNYIRYEDLSRLARRLNAGLTLNPSEWEPNAGTKMVKDVMNQVKKKYKWIDLLKPETNAAVGVLLALDPSQLKNITNLPSIVGKKIRGDFEADKRLSGEGFQKLEPEPNEPVSFNQLLGSNIMEGLRGISSSSSQSEDELLLIAEKSFKNQAPDPSPPKELLGTGQLIWDKLTGWITGVGEDEALRRALLDWLEDGETHDPAKQDDTFDKTYSLSNQDDTFKDVMKTVGSEIDFIVTGHTHLARTIPLDGGRHYFNCGTWIRLLGFKKAMLKNQESFKEIYEILKDGGMDKIDGSPLDLDITSAVCITKDTNGKVVGQLAFVKDGLNGKPDFDFK